MLHLAVGLTLLFCGVIAALRAQPFDDGGLRAVLFSPACAPPCFMDIQPGVTTHDEAVQRLEASAWVASVASVHQDSELTWTWNGHQPAFLRAGDAENHLLFHNGVVYRIDLLTWASMGTFVVVFGLPAAWYYSSWTLNDPRASPLSVTQFEQHATYGSGRVEVAASGLCPLSIETQWALLTQISMPALPDHAGYGFSPRLIPPLPERCR